MALVSFLIHLMGATLLLLYAVRMVRTGIERAFGPFFRQLVTREQSAITATASGLGLAVILQSSAAVALLAAGFAGAGLITFGSGLALSIGADLGSAVLIQLLSFRMEELVPVLLMVGAGLFLKSSRRSGKQAGRIILGIAFILISLQFLRDTMEPIRHTDFLPAIADYLESDFITAFLTGAALAFLMHSSVAAILMCVTLVAVGAVPEMVGISLVLGANLGSALIPVWLSRDMPPAARRIPLANLTLRGTGAVAVVCLLNNLPIAHYLHSTTAAQTLVNTHIAFNALLLLLVPFRGLLERPFTILIPEPNDVSQSIAEEHRSVLDERHLENPALALSCLKREILRMVHLVETMCTPVMDLYKSPDKQLAKALIAHDKHVNDALDGIRLYVSNLPLKSMSQEDQKLAQALAEYAISVESAGDTVVDRLIPRSQQKAQGQVRFSSAGNRELIHMHEKVVANFGLAANVLVSGDAESARLLLEEKTEMARLESASRKKHLQRLAEGGVISFESSNIHLETLRAYKDLNSQIAAVAYPILYRSGQLLETRLISRMAD